MIKGLVFFIIVLALASGAAWLADQPGAVSLVWRDWQVETSAPVLAAAVVLIAVMAALLYRFWTLLRAAPAVIGSAFERGRRRKGYLALSRGMVAIAAGDAREAAKNAKRARGLLSDPPLTLLLEAQAAQLNGDERAAEKFFTRMLDDEDMAFLGLRGLYNQALAGGQRDEALQLARRAAAMRPKSEWAAKAVFDLETKSGNWLAAEADIKTMQRRRLITTEESRRQRAVLERMQSADAADKGETETALAHAKKAFDLAPGFVPAAHHYAGLLARQGKSKKAQGVIEKAWKQTPHADLAALYGEAATTADPVAHLRRMERLGALNPYHPETHLALARAAVAASLWGEARRHLKTLGLDDETSSPLGSEDVDARAFHLMADVLTGEGAAMDRVRPWLSAAADAPRGPTWVCQGCGNTLSDWTALCARCGAFDRFEYGPPARVTDGDGNSN